MRMLIDCMYIIINLIQLFFVLTCRVLTGLFITLMSLEGMRDTHRRLIGVSTVTDPHLRHNKLVAVLG
jgi:hypothetical protein